MRRVVSVLLCASLLVLATAVAALAAPSFQNGEVQPDSEVTLLLKVPEHKVEEDHRTVRVDATLPDGFTVLGCQSPSGWDCVPSGQVVRWRSEDTLLSTQTDAATYEILVRTPSAGGSYPVRTVQFYQDRHWTAWTVGGNTAPKVRVAGAAPQPEPTQAPEPTPEPTEPTEAPEPTPDPTEAPAPAPTTAAPRPAPTSSAATDATPSSSPGANPSPSPSPTSASVELEPEPSAGAPLTGSGPLPDDDTLEAMAAEQLAEGTTEGATEGGGGGRLRLGLVAAGLLALATLLTVHEHRRRAETGTPLASLAP